MKLLRIIALLEGVSYLLLLGVCMPLKYIFNLPQYTYPVGLAHGVLFVSYCMLVIIYAKKMQWTLKQVAFLEFLSLLPFGTFYAEKRWFR